MADAREFPHSAQDAKSSRRKEISKPDDYSAANRSINSVLPVAFAVSMAMAVPLTTIIAMMLVVTPAVALTIARRVVLVVPAILHEVDWFPTGVVLLAMLAPVFRVARRYA